MNLLDLLSFMHYQDSGIYPTHKSKTIRTNLWRRFNIIAKTGIWFNHITRHWSIHKKIGSGYILSIGIAILGTGVGLMVGEHYDDQGVKQFRIAQQRYTRINLLEKAVWQVKFNQQQMIIASQINALQPQEIQRLKTSITEANNQLHLLKDNLKDYHALPEDYATELKNFLQVCDQEVDSYTQLLDLLLQKVTISNPREQDIEARDKILQEIINGQQGRRVEQLSQTLEDLVDSTGVQEKKAGATFRRAKVLRLIIIIVSMVLSMEIAMALAFYTSRAIARPIQEVTNVAKQVTQEGNFHLQATVTPTMK